MTDYTWPSGIVPNSVTLTWADNSARFSAPYSSLTRSVGRPGGRWRMAMSFQLSRANAQTLEAFLWRLNGAAHVAVIPDHSYKRQATGAVGTPIVDGASQTGYTLTTSGWGTGVVLKAGDRIGVNDEMYVVVSDVDTTASSPIGDATITLAAPLRRSPSNGASITVAAPTVRYMLSGAFETQAMPGVFKSMSAEFEEVAQ